MKTGSIKIGGADLNVRLATTPKQQAKGLMDVSKLPENEGMLFCYPEEKILSFWMKSTPIPLSIAFFDRNKKIIQIEDLKPNDEASIKTERPAMWALKVNQGWFQKNNISLGEKMILNNKRSINIKIVKLPPEAQELAKKIEDTLTKMIGKVVDSMVTPGNKVDTFNIDVSEINKKDKK